ncbi:MAG TPA: CvpA family protein [Phycisphaerae bacterium]|nr:CvpA family protein [Phycisphaerae bacterium]
MLLIFNLLAVAAMVAVAYIGAVQGLYRSAKTLVACLVAGAAAFGLFAPVAGLFDSANPDSVWYYAADALALWAIFSVAFLGLRTLGEKTLRVQPTFPGLAEQMGGAAVGAVTGYLVVGMAVVLAQMLPLEPEIVGYAPFQYYAGKGEVEPGNRLWLAPDRGTLALFGYLSGGPLGGEERRLFNRYGNVYPPDAHSERKPDADDMLYYHWMRRWKYVKWRTGVAQGPLASGEADEAPGKPGALPGVPLRLGRRITADDLLVRLSRIERADHIEDFPDLVPPAGHVFLVLTLDLSPGSAIPAQIDTRRFVLLAEDGKRYTDPLLYGPTRLGRQGFEIEHPTARPPLETTPRNLRFGTPKNKTRGHYVMDGAVVHFSDKTQGERLDMVYTLPADLEDKEIRFVLEDKPAPAEAAPETPPN